MTKVFPALVYTQTLMCLTSAVGTSTYVGMASWNLTPDGVYTSTLACEDLGTQSFPFQGKAIGHCLADQFLKILHEF